MLKLFKSTKYSVFIRKLVPNSKLIFEDKSNLSLFKEIKTPHLYWAADPFLLKIHNKNYLFVEYYNKLTCVGKIAYLCLDEKNSKWKTIIKEKTHLSFPNCFIYKNKLLIIPESSAQRRISQYTLNIDTLCLEKKETILDDVIYVDSTFLNVDESFLFATSNYESKNEQHKLFLFDYDIENRKLHHKYSVNDINNQLRPAGKMFLYNNEIIIPTQDCSRQYGEGVIINKLLCTSNEYSVKRFIEINRNDIYKFLNIKPDGIHTYNFNDDYEVIDIQKNSFSLFSFLGKSKILFNLLFRKKKNND